MSHTRVRVKSTLGSKVKWCLKSCLSNNLQNNEANLIKLHRKKKHNEKVCHAHELGFSVQGQGHNQGSEGKSSFCNSLKPTEANFVKLSKKVNHNKKVCHIENLYSLTQGQGHSLGSDVKLRLFRYSAKYQSKL